MLGHKDQGKRFRDLQNHTTLKPEVALADFAKGFRDLQNHTTLKPQIKF